MKNLNRTALSSQTGQRLTKRISLMLTGALLGLSQQALAHVEYYDLNQYKQIVDLTVDGKDASTVQYGSTPAPILALNPSIVSKVDMPLNDTTKWTSTYQNVSSVGTFTGTSYDAATGYGTATVDVSDVTSFGWYEGTLPVLGDSHKVDFFNFRLYQKARVTIIWNVNSGAKYFDNGFSLYKGVLPYQGHDDATEELNPLDDNFNNKQDPLDSNSAPVDVQGIASAYRDTLTNAAPYVGQFNAYANWGQANVSGNWGNISFIQAVNAHTQVVNPNTPAASLSDTASDTLESLTIELLPGNYTIAASGARSGGSKTYNLHGRLTFTAEAVPCP